MLEEVTLIAFKSLSEFGNSRPSPTIEVTKSKNQGSECGDVTTDSMRVFKSSLTVYPDL